MYEQFTCPMHALVAMVVGISNTIETVWGEAIWSPQCTPRLPMLYYLLVWRRVNGTQLWLRI